LFDEALGAHRMREAVQSKTDTVGESPKLAVERTPSGLVIQLGGEWRLTRDLPQIAPVIRELQTTPLRKVTYDSRALTGWDSSLLALVDKISERCKQLKIEENRDGLPDGLRALLRLSEAVPDNEGARGRVSAPNFVAEIGGDFLGFMGGIGDFLAFFGEISIALGRFLRGKARFRGVDMATAIQDCGVRAFGIVSLISFLVGVILAFMGAVQLEQFGAAIYVADLVGVGMVRDMGAMMTAIIMAGRTGAAFAAQLGTMKVTQEIDALTTMGISPIEFLVLPRVIALFLMMPLLCIYADFVGVLGGAAVGAGMLNITMKAFLNEAMHALTLGGVIGGVVKATVYGVIVSVAGCLRGMQCGNSSSAVGEAATAAVVTGIVYIVVACGIFAVIFHILYI
jgi:phospholipid/cholesterol/gamma-HCH transport system permease protein